MRRFLFGVMLVSGCFNPLGTDSGTLTTSGATTTATGATTGDGTNPTTGVTGTTTAEVTTTTTTAMSDPTTGSSSGTAGTTDTTTGSTTSDVACDPPCGPCKICQAGACVAGPGMQPCDPPPGQCATKVWGVQDGVCYKATGSGGICSDAGVCQPVCDLMGEELVGCIDAECLKPGHPCTPGAPAANVSLANLCASGDTTPDCMDACDNLKGFVVSHSCDAGGACTFKGETDCLGHDCDPVGLVCKIPCNNEFDCIPGYQCQLGVCQMQ